jgi:hypothetical protein
VLAKGLEAGEGRLLGFWLGRQRAGAERRGRRDFDGPSGENKNTPVSSFTF